MASVLHTYLGLISKQKSNNHEKCYHGNYYTCIQDDFHPLSLDWELQA